MKILVMSNIIRISDLQYEKKSSVSLMLLQRGLPTADRADSSSGSCYSGWSYLQAILFAAKKNRRCTCPQKKRIGVVLGGYMQLCENGLATASMVVQVGNRRPRIAHAMSVHKRNAILIVQRVKVSNNLNFD